MPVTVHDKDVSILAALADPIRLRIVTRLSKGQEIAGVELAKDLCISRALLCHHAGILVKAGVASRRKEGQMGYLRLNAARLRRCVTKLVVSPSSRKTTTSRSGVTAASVKRKIR